MSIKSSTILLLIGIFIYMLVINLLSPMFADDYNYSFMWDKSKRIENIVDVLRSQYIHYFEWGGRSVSHTIGQILLMTNNGVSSTLNAIVFTFFIYLLYRHSQGIQLKYQSVTILLLIFFFCWTSFPSFGETNVWLIGSVNYLWTSVFILLFLLPFRNKLLGSEVKDSFVSRVSMLVLGVLAGWSNENTALSTLIILSIFIIYFYVKKRLDIWMITGSGGSLIGFLFLILAPGNLVRANQQGKADDYSFALYHIKIPAMMTLKIMLYQTPLWIALFLFVGIIFMHIKKAAPGFTFMVFMKENRTDVVYSILFIWISILNNIIMFVSPYFPFRAGFGSSMFLMIGVVSLLRINAVRNAFINKKMIYSAALSLLLVVSMSAVFIKYAQLKHENQSRIAFIEENLKKGNDTLTVSAFSIDYNNPLESYLSHVFVSDIGKDSTRWPNNVYSQYYGLKSINLE
ncbi:DUF3329 domain-containing protein [Paenibacillus castaneae]|nr:DUF6056 family protein [Paenibacillus castaneae]